MPDITDPEAIAFSNQKIRPTADVLEGVYRTCRNLVDEWNATSMSAKITNTADPIIDGAATDGRTPITGINATAVVTRAIEFVTDYEASSNAKLNTVIIVSVNPHHYTVV